MEINLRIRESWTGIEEMEKYFATEALNWQITDREEGRRLIYYLFCVLSSYGSKFTYQRKLNRDGGNGEVFCYSGLELTDGRQRWRDTVDLFIFFVFCRVMEGDLRIRESWIEIEETKKNFATVTFSRQMAEEMKGESSFFILSSYWKFTEGKVQWRVGRRRCIFCYSNL